MSEEEKKAIEIVKGITEDDLLNYWYGPEEPYNAIQTVLNLLDKQQKEIEVLREENFDTVYMKAVADFKDKIREKIKELEQIQNTALTGTTIEIMDYKITILKQLLEE